MKDKPSICTSCSRRKGSIFCELPSDFLERLERQKIIFNCQPGQIIFSEGNPSFLVYHIFSGFVKLSKSGRKGEKLVIRLRGPGDIFGHRAVLTGEPYTAEAMALVPTTICAIQKEVFLEAIKEYPDFAIKIMAKLSTDLRASEEQTMSIAHEEVKQRVARLLLFLVEHNEEFIKRQLVIPNSLSRSEMAQMIGTTPESFSRTLRLFIERKYIDSTRTEIRIIDPTALRSLYSTV